MTEENPVKLHGALNEIALEGAAEAFRAATIHPPMNSLHEGYAVILEEVDELWECVRMKEDDVKRPRMARGEAIQVIAMGIRMIHDCIGPVGAKPIPYRREIVVGQVFSDDPDCESEILVGQHVPGGYKNFLHPSLEKFVGKHVRITIEELGGS
ncbi:MAG: hypothetical protein ABFC24_08650 [Methanoregulaceae archaeon]